MARQSLHLSKYQIVGNHRSRLNYHLQQYLCDILWQTQHHFSLAVRCELLAIRTINYISLYFKRQNVNSALEWDNRIQIFCFGRYIVLYPFRNHIL